FAALLKSHRRTAHLTQEELAHRAGVSVRTVSGLETRTQHTPYKETVRLLARALELSREETETFIAAARLADPAAGPATVIARSGAPCPPLSLLPAPVTPLLGRERELEEVGTLLLRTDVRLLTLYGPPGVGKTRLALEVMARQSEAFADGAFMVSLAPLHDCAHVVPAAARVVGVRDTGSGDLKKSLFEVLREQCALLLLDNFEHLLAAAPFVGELLEACAHIKVLVTSREKLRLRGEQTFPVCPLPLPESDDVPLRELAQMPSVQLFLDRARRVTPSLALTQRNAPAISAICRRLDGLPLALELAAARITLLTPEQLLDRLEHRLSLLTTGARDLPRRQQTLRDALAWSYDLLDTDERAMFRRFSVFAGGACLEAIHAICQTCLSRDGDESQQLATLDIVTSLVDKSLLVCNDAAQVASQERGNIRVRMLETMREYAGELLVASGEAEETCWAHAEYFAVYAEAAEQLRWPERGLCYRAFEDDLDNFRAALRWAMSSRAAKDVELGLRLAGALGMFWYYNGHLSEGAIWLQGLLARSADAERASAISPRAKALHMAGWIAIDQGEYAKAVTLLKQSVAFYRDTDECGALAAALNRYGDAMLRQGDRESAAACFSESLELRRLEGDLSGIAATLNNLAAVASELKQYVRAQELLEEAHGVYVRLGEQSGALFVLNNLADLARDRGDYEDATRRCWECVSLARRIGDTAAEANSLGNLAHVTHERGDYEGAEQLWRKSLALQRQLGNSYAIAFCLHELADIERDEGRHDSALALYWESLDLYRRMAVTRGAVACLEGLASIAASREQADHAAELCGVIAALHETMGTPSQPAYMDSYERAVAQARVALGEKRFTAAWASGRHLPAQDALAAALAIASSICQER
ncbi:MAG TPA: tetratricopeptide repeat protein, partial [Ktedonobacterales bacterium]|nr:tetratricopeptide repeat protein [Ktedonobacterales bacterium]